MKKIQYNGESKLLSGIATKINWLIDQVGTKIDASEKGVANGVATLDGGGKVPSSQLPSYVDDVIEGYYYNDNFYSDSAHTELITPETSKIYVDLPTNKTYRWGGSEYVEISSGADEKVKQSPYTTSDTNARELLLSKSTDGLEHTEEAYKSDALKFKYGIGFSQFYIGDYDSQDGYYKSHVYCKWIDCYSISATEISDLWGIALGNQQNNGILRIQNTNGHGVNVYAPTDLTEGEDVRLPSSSGQLALKSEIPTALSQLTDDSTHRLVTDIEKSTWNNDVKWSENNVLGAKNLLPFPYMEITNAKNGITFTVNSDYSVTVSSGSPSANTNWYFRKKEDFLPSGKYIVSGFNDTAQGNAFCLCIVINQDMSDTRTYNDYGSGTEITVNDGDVVSIYLHMGTSGVSSGNKHYVMVRPSTVEDSTYQEPTLTNRQLTERKTSWEANKATGVKNYINYPYNHPMQGETYTIRAVDYTDNGDGGIVANGTCDNTGNSYCQVLKTTSTSAGLHFCKLPKGRYHFSGGISDDYYMNLSRGLISNPSATRTEIGTDYGDGFDFDVTEQQANESYFCSFCFVAKNKTATNVVFYPSITRYEDTSDGYAMYAMTNAELTQIKADMDNIAPTETSGTAVNSYAVGDYMWWRHGFYRVTQAIAVGDSITTSKVTKTTLGAELKSALT